MRAESESSARWRIMVAVLRLGFSNIAEQKGLRWMEDGGCKCGGKGWEMLHRGLEELRKGVVLFWARGSQLTQDVGQINVSHADGGRMQGRAVERRARMTSGVESPNPGPARRGMDHNTHSRVPDYIHVPPGQTSVKRAVYRAM